ncbi:MAG TPA: methanogen output domain 1-containing protein [Methanobacteriaceae archaeon]|nr:methanogen output domain 1-containing protein [Methanobacteriaceae archaeon]
MSKSRILVVEDEAIVAMGIKQKLEDLGHQVLDIVFTGEDAVKIALETKPDVILMDIVLKGDMDGIEAAGKIRNHLDVPVIYLTAYSDEDVLKRARITEPYGYILKPFKKSEVNANIEMALYKHQAEKKKSEVIKKQVMADFYDFILNSMPTCAEQSDTEMRSLLLKVFSERLENEMRPSFEEEMVDLIEEGDASNLEEIFNVYLTWLSRLFAGLGILTVIKDDEGEYIFEFQNCPWIEEASKKPVFCLNCQAIVNQSMHWTGIDSSVDRKLTIADGGDACIFRFNLPNLKKNDPKK